MISGALHGLMARSSLSPLVIEVVSSWVTLGALFGALAAGELADRIGRKRTVLIAGAMFTLGSLVLAPTALRGRFVSAYQLAITIGIFLAYMVDGWLSQRDAGRFMLGASAVPGLLLFGVALVAPKSPRWLMKMNRRAVSPRDRPRRASA